MNKRQKYLEEKSSGLCEASKIYAERYLPSEINTITEAEAFVTNDMLFLDRLNEICVEIGSPVFTISRERALTIFRMKRMNTTFMAAVGNFEPTSEWRWTDASSTSLFTGSLDELQNIPTVEYDDNKWWFAKGIDGSVLNNEEEIESYKASLIRERKYYDAADDLILWKTE